MDILSSVFIAVALASVIYALLSSRAASRKLKEISDELEAERLHSTEAIGARESLEKETEGLKELLKKQETRIEDLKTALNSDSFDGRFPICSKCKDIRDEKGCWHSIEEFIAGLSEAEFSHSLCPDCAKELYPDMFEEGKKLHTLTWK